MLVFSASRATTIKLLTTATTVHVIGAPSFLSNPLALTAPSLSPKCSEVLCRSGPGLVHADPQCGSHFLLSGLSNVNCLLDLPKHFSSSIMGSARAHRELLRALLADDASSTIRDPAPSVRVKPLADSSKVLHRPSGERAIPILQKPTSERQGFPYGRCR